MEVLHSMRKQQDTMKSAWPTRLDIRMNFPTGRITKLMLGGYKMLFLRKFRRHS